jgi:hypothetical protein
MKPAAMETEIANDSWKYEAFSGDDCHEVKTVAQQDKFWAFAYTKNPEAGYITNTDFDEREDYWPGPVVAEFGPDKKYKTAEEALAATITKETE